MDVLRSASERFWGPVHFTSLKVSTLVARAFRAVEVRVQGGDGLVHMRCGEGRWPVWQSLSVSEARELATNLVAASDVAEGLPARRGNKMSQTGSA